jgi:hypothetical protein
MCAGKRRGLVVAESVERRFDGLGDRLAHRKLAAGGLLGEALIDLAQLGPAVAPRRDARGSFRVENGGAKAGCAR